VRALPLVLAALTLLGHSSLAIARPLAEIHRRGLLSLCAAPNALPFAAKRGEVRGLQIDLAQEIARRLGVQLAIEWVTEAVMYRRVDCDIVMDMIVARDVSSEVELRHSVPYQRSGVALARRTDAPAADGFEDLPPAARIGVMFGSLAQVRLGERGHTVIPFGFEDEIVEAVASGEIDAGAVTPTTVGWHNHRHPDRSLALIHAYDNEPELAWDLAVGLRRSDHRLREEMNRIVKAILEDGTVSRIYAAYGIEHRPPAPRNVPRYRAKAAGGEAPCVGHDCAAKP
jgi:polar amino acid transport system substrate-binding protein